MFLLLKPNPPAVAFQAPAPTRRGSRPEAAPAPAASPHAPALALCCPRALDTLSPATLSLTFALKMKLWLLLGLLLVQEALEDGE